MLTAKQAAKILGLETRTVYDIPLDRLPRYRLGRSGGAVRFALADVEAYKAALLQQPRPEPLPRLTDVRKVVREYRAALAAGVAPRDLPAIAPHLVDAADARHRRQVMTPWANGDAIRAIYAEAKRLTRQTGVKHHVDHIIPLQGALVSGLHVETNLQVLPADANVRKKNSFAPC